MTPKEILSLLREKEIRAVDPGFSQALCHMMDLSVDKVAQAATDLLKVTELQAANA